MIPGWRDTSCWLVAMMIPSQIYQYDYSVYVIRKEIGLTNPLKSSKTKKKPRGPKSKPCCTPAAQPFTDSSLVSITQTFSRHVGAVSAKCCIDGIYEVEDMRADSRLCWTGEPCIMQRFLSAGRAGRKSIYSSWNGRNMMWWQVSLTYINGRHCGKAGGLLALWKGEKKHFGCGESRAGWEYIRIR